MAKTIIKPKSFEVESIEVLQKRIRWLWKIGRFNDTLRDHVTIQKSMEEPNRRAVRFTGTYTQRCGGGTVEHTITVYMWLDVRPRWARFIFIRIF
jgi:hypothetical protein